MASASGSPPKAPILLLKTKSSPHDGYDEFFSAATTTPPTTPIFIPVLSHNFHNKHLSDIKNLFDNGCLLPGSNRRYGGLIFTSQRAVEAFAGMVEGVDSSKLENASHDLPLYTVGPATARSLTTLRDQYLPHATIHGAETGNGGNLAKFILEHYNGLFSRSATQPQSDTEATRKPPLLFLVGEVRRDIIPKTLTDPSLPSSERIAVEEVVVYETGVVAGFESDFENTLRRFQDEEVIWVVVFSPTGCDAMVRVLRREREKGKAGRTVFVATIGPTTRDHLVKECGFEPDVCAERPSPEGVGEGIRHFMMRMQEQGT
ncbi:tetrapyrrole biosynthesis, uroporphyrinogen III synthase [Aspergillus karnatakaensis]|uniref:uroporphyrinogen-III synthase HEM4 n=1 Tax=Aspergillus karnatakaensis TaxID=1810916 RepID=UPI003CCDDE7B